MQEKKKKKTQTQVRAGQILRTWTVPLSPCAWLNEPWSAWDYAHLEEQLALFSTCWSFGARQWLFVLFCYTTQSGNSFTHHTKRISLQAGDTGKVLMVLVEEQKYVYLSPATIHPIRGAGGMLKRMKTCLLTANTQSEPVGRHGKANWLHLEGD